MRHLRVPVFAVVLLSALSCAKDREPTKEEPVASFTEAEAERGTLACDSFAARVCACAEGKPEKADECDLARGRPEALALALRAVRAAEGRPDKDRWAIDQNARKIIKECIEADLELDPGVCPRLPND